MATLHKTAARPVHRHTTPEAPITRPEPIASVEEEYVLFRPRLASHSSCSDATSVSDHFAPPQHDGAGLFESAIDLHDSEIPTTSSEDESIPASLSISDSSEFPSQRDASPSSRPLGNESWHLTELALSQLQTVDEADAGFTSGEDDFPPDEGLLSRTPQAISAGISRRRVLEPRTVHQSTTSSAQSPTTSKRRYKRRHRQSGISDKGSKRSHTSEQSAVLSVRSHSIDNIPRSAPAKLQNHVTFTLKDTLRSMVDIESETIELLRRTPPKPSTVDQHGWAAFRRQNSASSVSWDFPRSAAPAIADMEEDSGDETETEGNKSTLWVRTSHDLPRYRSKKPPEAELTRSFSLTLLPQLLADSVFNQRMEQKGQIRRTSSFTSASSERKPIVHFEEQDGFWRRILRTLVY